MTRITAVAGENMRIKCPVAGYPINEIRWEKGKCQVAWPKAGLRARRLTTALWTFRGNAVDREITDDMVKGSFLNVFSTLVADNKELPEDLRQKTDLQLGVLTVLSVQKGVDSGAYTCVANNKHGHSAKRTTTVDVIGKVTRLPPRAFLGGRTLSKYIRVESKKKHHFQNRPSGFPNLKIVYWNSIFYTSILSLIIIWATNVQCHFIKHI